MRESAANARRTGKSDKLSADAPSGPGRSWPRSAGSARRNASGRSVGVPQPRHARAPIGDHRVVRWAAQSQWPGSSRKAVADMLTKLRSEERRVGKEGRSREAPEE